MPGDTYIYFDEVRARGEAGRMLLALSGAEHTIENFGDEEWAKRKNEFPLKELPVLITEDGMINQSNSIMRYLGRKHSFSGSSNWDEAVNDAQIENGMDAMNKVLDLYKWMKFGEPKPETAEKDAEACVERWKLVTGAAEQQQQKKGGKFINGDQIQTSDIWMYTCLEFSKAAIPNIMELTDWVKSFVSSFEADERVQKYLAARPPTKYDL